jgi:hypothetical protein
LFFLLRAVATLVVDIGVGWRRFVRSQSAIPCAWVTLPRGIYRRAHVALRKAGVWLHVPGAGWGYEKTGTCTSPQEAWRCGDLKFPDTSNSCDLERARKTSERNERRRNNEQRPTDSDEPPLSPSPWTIAPRRCLGQRHRNSQTEANLGNMSTTFQGLSPAGNPEPGSTADLAREMCE